MLKSHSYKKRKNHLKDRLDHLFDNLNETEKAKDQARSPSERDPLLADIANINSNIKECEKELEDLAKINTTSVFKKDYKQMIGYLHICCMQEIHDTIGPKYIKGLYVDRALGTHISNKIAESFLIQRKLSSILEDYAKFLMSFDDLLWKNEKIHKDINNIIKVIKSFLNALEAYEKMPYNSPDIHYPATKLSKTLQSITKKTLEIKSKLKNGIEEISLLDEMENKCSKLIAQISAIDALLLPLFLIVDRAGSGKTNLLCNLAEELSNEYLCFFLSGKSIPDGSAKTTQDYLSTVYQIGDDPIATALDLAEQNSSRVLFVIDGINESLNTQNFNAALKTIIKRYYKHPITFIISCRDLYWKYFEDDFWKSHCSTIHRSELYEFNKKEFDQAISKYFEKYYIDATVMGRARSQLHHPLLLRFYCEAFKGDYDKKTIRKEVTDIRLLELFNEYCKKKFEQIRLRLGLISSEEILDYLIMIAKIMLEKKKAVISSKSIACQAKISFHETEIRTIHSRYFNILDEDILIEEKPDGPHLNLKVSFVYEEFMEYVIARAIWIDSLDKIEKMNFAIIRDQALNLIQNDSDFLYIDGIIIYLGEMLADISWKDGLKFVDWLISQNMSSLAFSIFIRWPSSTLNSSVFRKLTDIHAQTSSNAVRKEVWETIEKVCLRKWSTFFEYITGLELRGMNHPTKIFNFLKRVGGGTGPVSRLNTIEWIVKVIQEQDSYHSPELDSAISAVQTIIEEGLAKWDKYQKPSAQRSLQKLIDIRDHHSYNERHLS